MDLAQLIEEINERFAGRVLDKRGQLNREIEGYLLSRGVRTDQITFSKGKRGGWVVDVRLAPEPGEITVNPWSLT